MKKSSLGLGLALAGYLASVSAVTAEPLELTFVHINDFYDMEGQKNSGGFARMATLVKQIRADRKHVLFTHGGDTFSPSLLSGFDQGQHMVDLFNKLGLDLFVPGNHEWDFGEEVAGARFGEAKFKILASNVAGADGKRPAGTSETLLMEIEGYKIGFYGVVTEDTRFESSPGGTTFADPLAVAKAEQAALKAAGADLVVALTHLDLDDDMKLITARTADLFLGGHDHVLVTYYDGKTALVESGTDANFMTVVDLVLDKKESNGRTSFSWRPDFRTVATRSLAPDPEMAAEVKVYQDRLSKELDIVIGKSETPLDSRRATVRGQEAAIANLIADAMRQATGADAALTNGGGIRADKEYPAGTTLTRRDILSELPFGNKTVLLEMTGADLLAALEHGFGEVEKGSGRFPQLSNVTALVDLSKPAGSRVLEAKLGGKPLDPKALYKVATNDFLAAGGDGYKVFLGKKNLIDESAAKLMATQVIDYIAAAKSVAPKVEGRIVYK